MSKEVEMKGTIEAKELVLQTMKKVADGSVETKEADSIFNGAGKYRGLVANQIALAELKVRQPGISIND